MVPTPIPSSTWSRLKVLVSGSLGDVLWIALVVGATIVGLAFLVALGPVGIFLATLLVSTLVSRPIREAYLDVLRRDFKTL